MKIIYALLVLGLLASCDEYFEESDLCGNYAPINYKNNFDTIQLKPQGLYHRKVYDQNKKLVLEMNGKWNFVERHSLKIDGYYMNLDDDLVKFPELVNDTDMSIATHFESRNGIIQFCIGHGQGENCYRKID